MKETLAAAYERGLDSLKSEIEAYSDETNIWKVADGITNSGGNLCLHLIGNLNHFIGANLGKTGYIRQRDLEFSDKGVSRDELLSRIHDVKTVVSNTINALSAESLGDDYPEMLFEQQMDIGTVLSYMTTHFSYHLGQLNYHRRLLDR